MADSHRSEFLIAADDWTPFAPQPSPTTGKQLFKTISEKIK